MDVHLNSELEQLVEDRVRSGHYDSATDVISEALRLLETRDRIMTFRKEEVQQKISNGLESLRLGKGVDGEAAFDRIERELDDLEHHGRR